MPTEHAHHVWEKPIYVIALNPSRSFLITVELEVKLPLELKQYLRCTRYQQCCPSEVTNIAPI